MYFISNISSATVWIGYHKVFILTKDYDLQIVQLLAARMQCLET